MRRLRGVSLLEATVAAVIFLTVFAAVMEVLPRLTVRSDDTLLIAEAEYRADRAFRKYASGEWPCGEYLERYEWGGITVRISAYDRFPQVQVIRISAQISGSDRRITHIQLVEWHE